MNPAASKQSGRRGYQKHGLNTMKKALMRLGSKAIDRRFTVGKALAKWRADLIRDSQVTTGKARRFYVASTKRMEVNEMSTYDPDIAHLLDPERPGYLKRGVMLKPAELRKAGQQKLKSWDGKNLELIHPTRDPIRVAVKAEISEECARRLKKPNAKKKRRRA